MGITRSIRKFEQEFDLRAERFICKHPFFGFLFVFVGMPIFILICVCISTTIIALPIAWLLGFL